MQIVYMAKKSETIKVGGIEIKDHRTVSFTTALLIGLVCLTVGALALHFFYMVRPSRPGCVQVMVKTAGGQPVPEAAVVVVISNTGDEIASGETSKTGKITFCDVFEPLEDYDLFVMKGDLGGTAHFTTNERSTASSPVIVRQTT